MALNFDESVVRALDILSSRIDLEKLNRKQSQNQRRNQITDIQAQVVPNYLDTSGSNSDIQISEDIQYLMRFGVKFNIRPLVTRFAKQVGIANLSINGTAPNLTINPNPHTHTVATEVSEDTSETFNDIRLLIDGIDVTNAIIAHYGHFIDSYGFFPSRDETIDIKAICEYLQPWQVGVILSSGYKNFKITGGMFDCTSIFYIKFNNIGIGGEFID